MQDINFDEITPDEFNQWLNQSIHGFRFSQLMPVADRQTKLAKSAADEDAVFRLYSMGVVTNRDEWVYDFDADNLGTKVRAFINDYEGSRAQHGGKIINDASLGTSIKWTRDLKRQLRLDTPNIFDRTSIRQTNFRPFIRKSLYFNQNLNEMQYQLPEVFPKGVADENKVICFCTSGKEFYVLASDRAFDLHFTGDTQCLPLYRYTADGERVSNITDWAVWEFNEHCRDVLGDYYQETYGGGGITAEDIFAYTYAVLHDPVYRHDYGVDLLREFPRLPFYRDFPDWVRMGKELLDCHLGFETAAPYALERREKESAPAKGVRPILRVDKEKGVITLDEGTTLLGVPESVWEYKLGSRSALEWVLDQYKERKPRDPTIRDKFNTYRFSDYKEQAIDLLRRVCTVSVETMEIVDSMAYWEDGHLGVFSDRDEYEWMQTNRGHRWLYGAGSRNKEDRAWSEA